MIQTRGEIEGIDISGHVAEIDWEKVELLKEQCGGRYLWDSDLKAASFTLSIEAFLTPTPCWNCGGELAFLGRVTADGDYLTACADCGACTKHPPDAAEP